jgi:hypothetical protein
MKLLAIAVLGILSLFSTAEAASMKCTTFMSGYPSFPTKTDLDIPINGSPVTLHNFEFAVTSAPFHNTSSMLTVLQIADIRHKPKVVLSKVKILNLEGSEGVEANAYLNPYSLRISCSKD